MGNCQHLLQVDDYSLLRGVHFVVLKGGPGAERAISLQSGATVANALRLRRYCVTEVDLINENLQLPKDAGLVFNMVHGTLGEDGFLQALLEKMGVPFTGEGAEGCRLAFNKILAKRRFIRAGVPTAPFEVVSFGQQPSIVPPFVLKAPCQGSSVGVHVVHNQSQMLPAMNDCLQHGDKVLVESFFPGREFTVSIIANTALPIVEIVPTNEIYDYENKYVPDRSKYFIPARLSSNYATAIVDMALAAHHALGLQIISRVDILLSESGKLNVLEVNTIPGMTPMSLMPQAAAAVGIDLSSLCEMIAVLSLKRWSKV